VYILIRKAVAHPVHTLVELLALGETSSADEEAGARPRQTHVLLRRKCERGGGRGGGDGTCVEVWNSEVGEGGVPRSGTGLRCGTDTLKSVDEE